MRFSATVVAAFSLQVAQIACVPVPQGAGTGSACDSILSDTDTGTGYAVKNVENTAAGLIANKNLKRQGAGTGAACGSLLSDTDTGTGYAVKNVEDTAAGLISNKGAKRQLNKWSDGLQDLSDAAGTGSSTSALTTELDNVDGSTTNGQAQLGAELGNTEVSTLEGLTGGGDGSSSSGSAPAPAPAPPAPGHRKRQLNKWSDGLQDLSDAAGTGSLTSALTTELDNVDGSTTNGQAQLGADLGNTEVSTLEGATGGGDGSSSSSSAPAPAPAPPAPKHP